ncbi:hypothetical protein EBZ39_16135 [bacterium]|nr:hypothetical protein [bacterium]
MNIWIGEIPDIFGGCGISTASTTKEGAEKAMRKEWEKRMLHSTFPKHETFEEHLERFGGHVTEVALERAYNHGFRE